MIARRSAFLLSVTAAIALSIAQPAHAISLNDPAAAAAGGIANYYDSANQFPAVVSLWSPNLSVSFCTGLMIHERKLDKMLQVSGPLTTCGASVEALLNEIQHSIAIQNEGFENLVRGSQISMAEVLRRAPSNWYLEAEEALNLGLIAGVI